MSRLQTIVGVDHQFNNAAAANDGYHNLVHLTQQAPTGALANIGRFYVKSSAGNINAFYMDDAGTEFQLTPMMPIRSAVNFDGTGAIRGTAYNATVTRITAGHFLIGFPINMPNTNYIVQVTGMANLLVPATCIGAVYPATSYATSVQVDKVNVYFTNQNNVPIDPMMGNVTVFSVT